MAKGIGGDASVKNTKALACTAEIITTLDNTHFFNTYLSEKEFDDIQLKVEKIIIKIFGDESQKIY